MSARGILFEEEHARAVARRLITEGYAARVERERMAGEDDDEDHPWAVLTDAPVVMLELAVDDYDGWVDAPTSSAPSTPLDLPVAPRRIKRDS